MLNLTLTHIFVPNVQVQSLFGGLFIDEHTDTYSKYWVKFLSAYRDEGIRFYALTLQNEPAFENDGYPSMLLRPYQQQALAKKLRYDLNAAGFEDVKILVHDHNWDIWDQPMEVLSDPEAKAAVDGTAWHCYGGDMNVSYFIKDLTSNNIHVAAAG